MRGHFNDLKKIKIVVKRMTELITAGNRRIIQLKMENQKLLKGINNSRISTQQGTTSSPIAIATPTSI